MTPLAILLLALPWLGQPSVEDEEPPALLRSVAVIGASLSDGAGLKAELEVDADFGDVLTSALARHGEVKCYSEFFFFMDAEKHGTAVLEAALAQKPTLVVALDYVFWFVYGSRPPEARLAGLERGLELLARFEVPLVVGDFPDISIALEGEGPLGGPLVTPPMLPSAEEREVLNARLREWAAERGNVVVAPISRFLERLVAGEPIELRGNAWPAGSLRELIQKDLLHPTVDGSIAVAVVALDALEKARDDVPADAVKWKAADARAALMAATAEEREKAREKERVREERRARRDEKKKEEEKEKGDDGALLPCFV